MFHTRFSRSSNAKYTGEGDWIQKVGGGGETYLTYNGEGKQWKEKRREDEEGPSASLFFFLEGWPSASQFVFFREYRTQTALLSRSGA